MVIKQEDIDKAFRTLALFDLEDTYNELRDTLLFEAEMRGLDPQYSLENESGTETPEGFSFWGETFSIRNSKLFELMVRGNLDKLKELIDDPEVLRECLEEVFGSYDQAKVEMQKFIEEEGMREAA
jgi:hypothetical protein